MKNFFEENKKSLVKIFLSFIILLVSFVFKQNGGEFFIYLTLCVIAYVIISYGIIIEALTLLFKEHTIDEKFLMTVASLGAMAIGEYFEACAVMLLYTVGEIFEDTATDNSREAIRTLARLRSDKARIKDGETKDASDIEVGEIIEVLPGERISLDGEIVDSSGEVDTSAITGESEPAFVKEGNEVFAGYLNVNSVLYVKVKRPLKESAAQRIIDLSEKAFEKKAKSEKFIKRFAKIYTPTVIILSILVAVVLPLFDNYDFVKWIYRAISMLAISCPCAIAVSVPLSYFCGLGYASRKGILIKGSVCVDNLSKTKTIAFDKTGTLTKAEPRVTKIEAEYGVDKIDLVHFACTAEQKSTHPVAKAIMREAMKFNIFPYEMRNFNEKIGYGVECDTEYGHIKAGSAKFVGVKQINATANIYVSLDGKYIGAITLGDDLKTNSKITFEKLRKLGVENKIILSGDKRFKVEPIAHTLLAERAYADLAPEDKLQVMEKIINENKKGTVVYCGDGINDTPSLARADVGISFGLASDSAIESSDVVIMDDDIGKVPTAIKISKKIRLNVIENIFASLLVKVVILGLSIFGIVPLWVAVASDVGLLILAVINALRSGK